MTRSMTLAELDVVFVFYQVYKGDDIPPEVFTEHLFGASNENDEVMTLNALIYLANKHKVQPSSITIDDLIR